MSNIFNNSIWPNGLQDATEGYPVFYPLGTNKVEIPDGITTMWPDGDKLIGDFVYKNGKVVGFIDTKALIASSSGNTTMNYSYININLPSIYEDELTVNAPNATVKKITWAVRVENDDNVIVTFKYKGCKTVDDVKAVDTDYLTNDIVDGNWSERLDDLTDGFNMFAYCENLESFNADLSNLTGGLMMFYECTALTTFTSDSNGSPMNLSSLRNGDYMFQDCSNLTSFSSDLPSLIYGRGMFYRSGLESFSSNLSSLENGNNMFYNSGLESFSSDLSSLTSGISMFQYCENIESFSSNLSSLTSGRFMFENCSNLTTFSSNLSSLTEGVEMFSNCSKLTSFSSNLSSLTNGRKMFSGCKLDALSVKNIIDTINTFSNTLHIGMGCNNTTEDKNLFAQEVGYADMTSLLAALEAKGWTVSAQYTGRPTTTYGLRRPTEDNLPVFAKLEEAEKHATHTSEDGTKKYRLHYFHETTGSTEGYTQFNSLEEAVEHFNVKPVERN